MNNIDQLKQEVKQILNEKPILMDSFDSSYLNDFHHILKENFSITNVKDSKLKNILNLLDTQLSQVFQQCLNPKLLYTCPWSN